MGCCRSRDKPCRPLNSPGGLGVTLSHFNFGFCIFLPSHGCGHCDASAPAHSLSRAHILPQPFHGCSAAPRRRADVTQGVQTVLLETVTSFIRSVHAQCTWTGPRLGNQEKTCNSRNQSQKDTDRSRVWWLSFLTGDMTFIPEAGPGPTNNSSNSSVGSVGLCTLPRFQCPGSLCWVVITSTVTGVEIPETFPGAVWKLLRGTTTSH